ncbi:uncharacterized protein LOC116402658 [Cucumis sativus]|uniref:uncharacterized protein LOC116402658 n=1 Tax=Cucumis sativus TaxID=3659 RepID=UPI0012F4CF8E|nr:uncharacterized protein LOC116402658 [Cucumis sativus]
MDNMKHSRPLVLKGYGGWLKVKNLPLDLWSRSVFEAIGDHFGGFIKIATETLNLTNCSEARIQVKRNLCGFVLSTNEISDHKRGNIFLHFGEFEFLSPPISRKSPSVHDVYKNSLDRLRIREALFDEGCDLSSFPPILSVPKSVFATLPRSRSPFQPLQHFPATSPAPEKMNSSGKQVTANSIGRDPEQPSPLINDTPKGHSCLKKQLGPAGINQNPINSAAGVLSRERKKEKASLITIMQNYDISSKIIKDDCSRSNQRPLPNPASTDPSLPLVSGFCNKPKSTKGGNSLQVHAPKILKHYIRKHTSFNNIWTALLKSELDGGCDLKIPISAPSRMHRSEPSISANNPDLLEVYCSKIQSSNCLTRLPWSCCH